MVRGISHFRETFRGFEDQYVIIGGTACDLIMTEEEMPFRATKDIDLVLIVEALTAEFGRRFWEFVESAGYEHCNKSTGDAQFYRFTTPRSNEYPYMIELFSRNPEYILIDDDTRIIPLPIDEEISSLSAILLNDAYYELLKSGRTMIDGVSVLNTICLIPFKAKAWLDLRTRRANGELIDSKNIKKHKNDIYRLAQMIESEQMPLRDEIKEDMQTFLGLIAEEDIDLKAIGISGITRDQLIQRMRRCYDLES